MISCIIKVSFFSAMAEWESKAKFRPSVKKMNARREQPKRRYLDSDESQMLFLEGKMLFHYILICSF